MPRTIDHIIACHEAANALRNKNKPIWAATLRIKNLIPDGCDVMPDELSAEQASDLGKKIASAIKSAPIVKINNWLTIGDAFDFDLSDIVDGLENITGIEESGMTADEELREVMDQLYDFADHNRIWIA